MPGNKYPYVTTGAPTIHVSNLPHKTYKITIPSLSDCHPLQRNSSRSLHDYICDSSIGPLCCDNGVDALTPQCGSTLDVSNREHFLPCSHQTKT